MFNKLKMTLAVSALSLFTVMPNTALGIPYCEISHVYFFGDSLTDSGFNDLWSFPVPLPAGKAPTFTTFGGYIWSQYIARDVEGFALPIYPGPFPPDTITNNAIYASTPIPDFVSGTLDGIDYAASGSTTNSTGLEEVWAPSLLQQVDFYLATSASKLDPHAVYFVWSGANDILTALSEAPPIPTQLDLLTVANTAANNVAIAVEKLSARGAKRVVVLSMPNIGHTPLIAGLAQEIAMPSLPADIKTLCFTFNSMLNTQLGHIVDKHKTKILYVDVYDLLDNVILATKAGRPYVVAGESFQFVNYTDPACGAAPAIYCPSNAPNNYVFADTLHPTGMSHRLLSLAVEEQLLHWQ